METHKKAESRTQFVTAIEKFMELSKAVKENRAFPEIPYLPDLFSMVPDLEAIPKKIRQQVFAF